MSIQGEHWRHQQMQTWVQANHAVLSRFLISVGAVSVKPESG
jgi:hypothetical protein